MQTATPAIFEYPGQQDERKISREYWQHQHWSWIGLRDLKPRGKHPGYSWITPWIQLHINYWVYSWSYSEISLCRSNYLTQKPRKRLNPRWKKHSRNLTPKEVQHYITQTCSSFHWLWNQRDFLWLNILSYKNWVFPELKETHSLSIPLPDFVAVWVVFDWNFTVEGFCFIYGRFSRIISFVYIGIIII